MVSGTAIPGVSSETLISVSADGGAAETSVAAVRQQTEPRAGATAQCGGQVTFRRQVRHGVASLPPLGRRCGHGSASLGLLPAVSQVPLALSADADQLPRGPEAPPGAAR